MKSQRLAVIVLVLVASTMIYRGVQGLKPDRPSSDEREPPEVIVAVAAAQYHDLPVVLKAAGRAEAKASVSVKAHLDGQVAAVLYQEGRPVHKGQVLLRMDAGPAKAQLQQAQAVLARDQAQLERVTGDSRRNAVLFAQGFISQSGLGQTDADLRAAQATIKADRAIVEGAQLQLGYTNVVAPMDGIAGAVLLPPGGSAKANDTPLVVINQIKPIYVSFAVPESELERLKDAMGKGDVAVSTSIAGTATATLGKLAFLDNAVDPTTGTIIAKASFANEGAELTPGQFAEVKVEMQRLPNALVIPASAVESGEEGPFVFVVRPDSTVELRAVKLAAEADGFVGVSSGLRAGERVVTEGQTHLRANSRVAVASSASAGSR
jgi:multidrug efflux system membrane fusion protein